MESNLAAWTAVTGPEATSNILKARGSLAGAYAEIGDLQRAVPMYEAVLADAERILGPDDPVISTAVNNVGYAYSLLGDLARTIEYYERGLAERLRVFGPDDLSTLLSRMNLAYAHMTAGHVAEAAAMYKAVIADQIRLFGPDNAMTLSAREGLASRTRKPVTKHVRRPCWRKSSRTRRGSSARCIRQPLPPATTWRRVWPGAGRPRAPWRFSVTWRGRRSAFSDPITLSR